MDFETKAKISDLCLELEEVAAGLSVLYLPFTGDGDRPSDDTIRLFLDGAEKHLTRITEDIRNTLEASSTMG